MHIYTSPNKLNCTDHCTLHHTCRMYGNLQTVSICSMLSWPPEHNILTPYCLCQCFCKVDQPQIPLGPSTRSTCTKQDLLCLTLIVKHTNIHVHVHVRVRTLVHVHFYIKKVLFTAQLVTCMSQLMCTSTCIHSFLLVGITFHTFK